MKSEISRRKVVKGAAWSAPILVVSTPAVAAAATVPTVATVSGTGPSGNGSTKTGTFSVVKSSGPDADGVVLIELTGGSTGYGKFQNGNAYVKIGSATINLASTAKSFTWATTISLSSQSIDWSAYQWSGTLIATYQGSGGSSKSIVVP